MEEEFAVAVSGGDAGGGFGGGESLDGKIAGKGERYFAGVEDADALVEFGLPEDGDVEEVAGTDEEAFGGGGGCGSGRRGGLLGEGGGGDRKCEDGRAKRSEKASLRG
ncbi:MAG TPA: hypothetical protein VKT52_04265 [Ktedonobacterales bacterium]|nr:hypothetical protein [Ktedonobacterales bacterium]